MSRVNVEDKILEHEYHRSFLPPDLNAAMNNNATEVLSMDLHYEDTRHVWLDIYRSNPSN